jgi:hypothetical protein
MILHKTQRGQSLEQIHQDTVVGLEVLRKFLPLEETVVTQTHRLTKAKDLTRYALLRELTPLALLRLKTYSRSPQ